MADVKPKGNSRDPLQIFTVEFAIDPHSTALVIIDMQKNGYYKDFGLGKFWFQNIPDQADY